MDIERKLATIERIEEIKSIPDADKICAYRVKDWWVVDQVNKYEVGNKVVYIECDAWVPTAVAPFLSKGKEPRVYEGIAGERLRTVRLKKQLSQGLLLGLSPTCDNIESELFEGLDVSLPLGIIKWEAPIPAQLAGQVRGNLPTGIIKTDQNRVQNIGKYLSEYYNYTFEKTEKLHGSSCTMYLDTNDEFHVCSRNLDLKPDENNSFWKAAIKYNVEQKMRDAQMQGIAIQGELIGEGINGNQYKTQLDFYVFDMFNVTTQQYAPSFNRQQIAAKLGLKHVPVIDTVMLDDSWPVEYMLEEAEGLSELNGSSREGIVWKCVQDPSISWKAVSNAWLLKND